MSELLRCEKIIKEFSGVRVLRDIEFAVQVGEVMALCGENGAGKSTLIKVLSGVYQKTSGEIFWEGKKVNIKTPEDANKLGIGVIHQDFPLSEDLTIMENFFLGRYPTKMGFVDWKMLRKNAELLCQDYEINLDVGIKVSELPIAQKQLVSIIKALSISPKLLIMDEPTSSLSLEETKILLKLIRRIRAGGTSIIYISHFLEEVITIADSYTILRDGKAVARLNKDEGKLPVIIKHMVGRDLIKQDYVKSKMIKEDHALLRVCSLSAGNKVLDVSFELKKGEILGIGGLVGAGRSELLRAIIGDCQATGKIFLNNKEIKIRSVKQAMKKGIGYIPEDRKTQGLFGGLSVGKNITITSFDKIFRNGFLLQKTEVSNILNFIKRLKIKTVDRFQEIQYLSGGNQQKAIFARWAMKMPDILFLDEPTRGVDVGSKEEIYSVIHEMINQGISIIMVSSDLPELLRMSDRVLVMHRGRITGEASHEDADEEWFMRNAAGVQ